MAIAIAYSGAGLPATTGRKKLSRRGDEMKRYLLCDLTNSLGAPDNTAAYLHLTIPEGARNVSTAIGCRGNSPQVVG